MMFATSKEARNNNSLPPRKAPDQRPHGSNAESHEPKPRSDENTMAIWTVVLGLSTVVLSIATAISAYFLHSTDTTISRQLDANRIQLRAYIGIDQIQTAGVPSSDVGNTPPAEQSKGVNLITVIKNFGPTPALDASPWVSINWYPNVIEPDVSKSDGNLSSRFVATIAPGQNATVGAVFVSDEDMKKPVIGNGRIFMSSNID